ncbi:unnamed protein product, partial [Prorocentrum cordatum]
PLWLQRHAPRCSLPSQLGRHAAPAEMRRVPFCALVAAVVSLLPGGAAGSEDVVLNAQVAIGKRCSGRLHGEVDKSEARVQLEQTGGALKDLVFTTLNSTHVGDSIVGNLFALKGSMLKSSLLMCTGLVMLILMLTVFPCCHLAICLCSTFGCYQRYRGPKTHRCFSVFACLTMCAGGVLLVCSAGRTLRAYGDVSHGVDNLACTSARVVNGTLSMVDHVAGRFEDIGESFEATSDFVTSIRGILEGTAQVPDAIRTARNTLELFRSVLELEDNTNPRDGGDPLLHVCITCESMATLLGTAASALDEGVGSALSDARGEVEGQLSEENLEQMREALRNGIQDAAGESPRPPCRSETPSVA